MWKGTRVLVTGAGGFIGSHVVERLCELGANVRALVRYNSRNDPGLLRHLSPPIREGLEITVGDVKDPDSVRRAIEDVEVVYHLAALIAIPYSYHSPLEFLQNNVLGTAQLLVAARHSNVQRIVHTSTSEVYGTALYAPINEQHPLQAQSPYSASKIAADKIAESFYRSFGLPVAIIRPFNTYGPRQSSRAVIPTVISQALAGQNLRLGSLHPTRDFTYVTDMTEAFVRMGERPGVVGRVVNFGSGREVTIAELVEAVGLILGKQLHVETEQQRVRPSLSEVERLIADASLARELVDWQPTVSLEEGLRRTVDWIRAHPELHQAQTYMI